MKLALVTSLGLSHPDSDLPLLVSELAGLAFGTDIVAWTTLSSGPVTTLRSSDPRGITTDG
jgi:hypothetical protein